MTEKMKPEIKTKWVAALRSGDYKQGRSCLFDGTSYCCLGVLLRTLGAEWQNDDEEPYALYPYLDGQLVDNTNELLDEAVLDRVGLLAETQSELTDKNDGRDGTPDGDAVPPASFAEIAQWIEENL